METQGSLEALFYFRCLSQSLSDRAGHLEITEVSEFASLFWFFPYFGSKCK